jgi:hypothetical protein
MIWHQVNFLDPAFLLQSQPAEHVSEVLPQVPVEHLPAVFGNEHHVIFALRVWLRLS